MKEGGAISSNAGDISYGTIDAAAGNALLSGALDYIDRLGNGGQVMQDADIVWLMPEAGDHQPQRF